MTQHPCWCRYTTVYISLPHFPAACHNGRLSRAWIVDGQCRNSESLFAGNNLAQLGQQHHPPVSSHVAGKSLMEVPAGATHVMLFHCYVNEGRWLEQVEPSELHNYHPESCPCWSARKNVSGWVWEERFDIISLLVVQWEPHKKEHPCHCIPKEGPIWSVMKLKLAKTTKPGFKCTKSKYIQIYDVISCFIIFYHPLTNRGLFKKNWFLKYLPLRAAQHQATDRRPLDVFQRAARRYQCYCTWMWCKWVKKPGFELPRTRGFSTIIPFMAKLISATNHDAWGWSSK